MHKIKWRTKSAPKKLIFLAFFKNVIFWLVRAYVKNYWKWQFLVFTILVNPEIVISIFENCTFSTHFSKTGSVFDHRICQPMLYLINSERRSKLWKMLFFSAFFKDRKCPISHTLIVWTFLIFLQFFDLNFFTWKNKLKICLCWRSEFLLFFVKNRCWKNDQKWRSSIGTSIEVEPVFE